MTAQRSPSRPHDRRRAPRPRRARRRLGLLVVGALAAAGACTTDDDTGTGAGGAVDTTSTVSTTPATTAAPAGGVPAAPTSAPPSSSTTTVDVADLPVDADGTPVPPASAAEAAARIVAVETAVRDGTGDLTGLGHHHQVLYRTLNRNPAWLPAVLATVDRPSAERIRTVLAAGNSSASTVGTPLASIPAWTIRPPRPPDELLGHYRAAEVATGVPWSVLAAVNLVETRMGRIVGDSSAGAQGPMQFMPATWELYGEGGDVYDDGLAIAAAARLLADTGAPGDLAAALHAYNPNDSYVASVLGYHAAMQADPWLYRALHGWQVYVSTVGGLLWLEEGYSAARPVPVEPTTTVAPPVTPTTS